MKRPLLLLTCSLAAALASSTALAWSQYFFNPHFSGKENLNKHIDQSIVDLFGMNSEGSERAAAFRDAEVYSFYWLQAHADDTAILSHCYEQVGAFYQYHDVKECYVREEFEKKVESLNTWALNEAQAK